MSAALVDIAISAFALIVGAALEELLPKLCGVGFPVLLASCVFFASKRPMRGMFMFAVTAGAMEDSLCNLPFATSIAYFAMLAAFVHATGLVRTAYLCAFPVYQLWIRMWTSALEGGMFSRFLMSVPIGAVTALCVCATLMFLDAKGAVDEA